MYSAQSILWIQIIDKLGLECSVVAFTKQYTSFIAEKINRKTNIINLKVIANQYRESSSFIMTVHTESIERWNLHWISCLNKKTISCIKCQNICTIFHHFINLENVCFTNLWLLVEGCYRRRERVGNIQQQSKHFNPHSYILPKKTSKQFVIYISVEIYLKSSDCSVRKNNLNILMHWPRSKRM